MNDFIVLSAEEKLIYIEQAALRSGLAQPVIEKDFWVCWILGKLFSLPEISSHLIFKGGTTLSKAYGLIQRFSEDIDVSLGRAFLGFEDDLKTLMGHSGTKRKKVLDSVQAACVDAIRDKIVPELRRAIQQEVKEGWTLEVDRNDPLSVLFHFPASLDKGFFSYITPYVKIELGARGDSWPQEIKEIHPYLFEAFPDVFFEDDPIPLTILAPERTFWEKATILHAEFHRPEGKESPGRLSRHYYDLCRLFNSPIGQKAVADLSLLEHVVQHKQVFFRSGWTHYEDALLKEIKLVPPSSRLSFIKGDYQRMREMFFSEPPDFETILKDLKRLEKQINSRE